MPADTWLYLNKHATRVHYIETDQTINAACGAHPSGMWPRHTDWRGTGSQTEYDTAATLPRCKVCLKQLGLTPAPEADAPCLCDTPEHGACPACQPEDT